MKGTDEWVLNHSSFQDWWHGDDSRLLWIKGDPGKGKMLMIALTTEFSNRLVGEPQQGILSYFLCQNPDLRLNDAVAALRGLIYLLIIQKKTLIQHLRRDYDSQGKQLFDGQTAFYALRRILKDMLRHSSLTGVYLLIDALDECASGLEELLRLIGDSDAALSGQVASQAVTSPRYTRAWVRRHVE